MVETLPLKWPCGWPRTPPVAKQKTTATKVTFDAAIERLYAGLTELKAVDVVVSINRPTWAGHAVDCDGRSDDEGFAVYFRVRNDQHRRVIACDAFDTAVGNVWSLAGAVEALVRFKGEAGRSSMLEKLRLAKPEEGTRADLSIAEEATDDEIDSAFKLAR